MLFLKFRTIRLYRKSLLMTTLFQNNIPKQLCFTYKTNNVSIIGFHGQYQPSVHIGSYWRQSQVVDIERECIIIGRTVFKTEKANNIQPLPRTKSVSRTRRAPTNVRKSANPRPAKSNKDLRLLRLLTELPTVPTSSHQLGWPPHTTWQLVTIPRTHQQTSP